MLASLWTRASVVWVSMGTPVSGLSQALTHWDTEMTTQPKEELSSSSPQAALPRDCPDVELARRLAAQCATRLILIWLNS